jgi:DNA-binding NarL/FixJ family response regulator
MPQYAIKNYLQVVGGAFILTAHEDERLIAERLKAGARGYLLKSDLTGQLLVASAVEE